MAEIKVTSEQVFRSVKKHLQAKSPLSVIRIGDGEAMMFEPNWHPVMRDTVYNNLSFVPANKDLDIIRHNLYVAIKKSDFVGVPTQSHNRLSKYWRKVDEIAQDLSQLQKDNFCSINLHWDFLDFGYLKDLLDNVDDVYYVSGRKLDEEILRNFKVKNVHSFIIAPQHKFSPEYQGDPHYPDQYWQVREWILSKNLKGKLCLVGAGFVGKIYLKWFKDAGGVALDIGSVFDFWAGLKTRGPGKGVGVTWDKYKLL